MYFKKVFRSLETADWGRAGPNRIVLDLVFILGQQKINLTLKGRKTSKFEISTIKFLKVSIIIKELYLSYSGEYDPSQ